MKEKSFVRIKETFNTNEIKDRQYSKISLITFSDFLQRTRYKKYGHDVKLHPYKWWQLWYIVEVPAFYMRLFLSKTLRIKETRNTHIATLILASIFDGFVGWIIAKLLDKAFS